MEYYNKSNPVGIALESGAQFDYEKEKYVTIDTLNSDICEISCEVAENDGIYNYTLKSHKTIVDSPFYINTSRRSSINIIYPLSMLESVLPQEIILGYDYSYFLQSDNHTSSFENLKTVLTDNNLVAQKLYDNAKDEEVSRNIVTVVRVFSYGFIVLISLIAAANVFNTISTNISLRRREFAMLKSVGMTQKGFNKMMNFECLLYGSKALVLGLPVSAGVTYLIYKAISDGFETTYHLPWGAIGVAILSVFLVVFATMLYSMNKIKKDNPIDALKNENI